MVDNPPVPPSGGGALTRKIGGLPTWGWIAIAAAGGVGLFMWLQSRKNNTTDTSSNTDTSSQGTSDQYQQDQLASVYSQIRDLQGQVSQQTNTATTLGSVTGLHVTGTYKNHINIAWDPVTGNRGYDISWTDQKGATGSGESLQNFYTLYNLPPGYKYTIRVRARPDLGNTTPGNWSSAISASTLK